MFRFTKKTFVNLVRQQFIELLSSVPVAIIVGSMVAAFLSLLDLATRYRIQHSQLIFALPFAGLLIHFLYKRYGASSEAGNNLILEEIQSPKKRIPAVMAPLILLSTVITHLFGGSAGREGTAVQIGGSIADQIAFRLSRWKADRESFLFMGIAAGFAAVFGTPFAGAIFAIEVVVIGKLHRRRLPACLAAAWLAHGVCIFLGIRHTEYSISSGHLLRPYELPLIIASGIIFGCCSRLFTVATHRLKDLWHMLIPKKKFLIPILGGVLLVGLSLVPGAGDYLGLGVYSSRPGGASIVSAFASGGVSAWSWLWKLLFTAVTLSAAFKGGEVTPLFFIGASLGNTLGAFFGIPVDLMAASGFLAVFAGASNTPLACTVMGMELFGTEYAWIFAIACYSAYFASGHKGIYSSQGIHRTKGEGFLKQ
jgi:H+/Cl- antiporter ClcA